MPARNQLQREAAQHSGPYADEMECIRVLGFENAGELPRRHRVVGRIVQRGAAIEVDGSGAEVLQVAETARQACDDNDFACEFDEHGEQAAAVRQHEAVFAGQQHDFTRELGEGLGPRAKAHGGLLPVGAGHAAALVQRKFEQKP